MTVYKLSPDPQSYDFALRDEGQVRIYDQFNGRSIRATWRPLDIVVADDATEGKMPMDYTLLGVVPIFSLRALDVLVDLLRPHGEVLPVRYAHGEYFVYNVTTVLDALDVEASEIKYFSSGRVMEIVKYQFRPEIVGNTPIFKIPQLPKAFVYVTDVFVERVKRHNLQGFCFVALSP